MTPPDDVRTGRWLSEDLYDLAKSNQHNFDVLIVGSGYGGSMAAAELAGKVTKDNVKLRVGLLERGKEYLPGMFPSRTDALPAHLRYSTPNASSVKGKATGLFDFKIGPDVSALVANGLGGGSLINAGVMLKPNLAETDFNKHCDAWPNDALFETVKQRLGASHPTTTGMMEDNTILCHPTFKKAPLRKTETLRGLGTSCAPFSYAPITVAMSDAGVNDQCTLCGDCMTGCNVGAKKSLDTQLLMTAKAKGLEIYTGAAVLSLRYDGNNPRPWQVLVNFTDPRLRRKNPTPLTLSTQHVILAAGTFGTPEILMNSKTDNLQFSQTLGTRFSGNGDNLLSAYKLKTEVNPGRDEHFPLHDCNARRVGPTITGMLTYPLKQMPQRHGLIQEFAVPAPLMRIFGEIVTSSAALYQLLQNDKRPHTPAKKGLTEPEPDPYGIDQAAIKCSALFGAIGHDRAEGVLRPSLNKADAKKKGEGLLFVDWPGAKHNPSLFDGFDHLNQQLEEKAGLEADGHLLHNPTWHPLSPKMEEVFDVYRGPVITVHPLGGCPIGMDAATGVVDAYGRVFNGARNSDFHKGLWVLDGSIIPCSLGVNPALTIATFAYRGCQKILESWPEISPVGQVKPTRPTKRPRFQALGDCIPSAAPQPTEIEICERLIGKVQLQGSAEPYMVELTLAYEKTAISALTNPLSRELRVAKHNQSQEIPSQIRIFSQSDWHKYRLLTASESKRANHALFTAPITGSLTLLNREASSHGGRVIRAGLAYIRNRGLRDYVQHQYRNVDLMARLQDMWRRGKNAYLLANRGGEIRRFDYDLTIEAPPHQKKLAIPLAGKLKGEKRLTYNCRANPLRQLTELTLTAFPYALAGNNILRLDSRFMATANIPLLRITQQTNQVMAWLDVWSLSMYFARLLGTTHLWSLRQPDANPGRRPTLLPGRIRGLPDPDITDLEIDSVSKILVDGEPSITGLPVKVRLTRYRGQYAKDGVAPNRCPLLFIHGYSASGTTFTHDAIPIPMAKYFWERGRDVWVIDLRTSAGMLTAFSRWAFEDAALADIPVAVAHIKNITGAEKLDVFAHCIGAVMISMSILTDRHNLAHITAYAKADTATPPKRYLREIEALPGSIRRLVLSQKGPALAYTSQNVLRSYLLNRSRKLFIPEQFDFQVTLEQGVVANLYDRLLNLLPYSDREYDRENPRWPWARRPWVGLRHRMDMLYGRDYQASEIANKTLEAAEDLFGPLNTETLAQAIHFTRLNTITNAAGENVFVSAERMKTRWGAIEKTLSVHGAMNGLADIETLTLMQELMAKSGLSANYQVATFAGMGHQDGLIGKRAIEMFVRMEDFLND